MRRKPSRKQTSARHPVTSAAPTQTIPRPQWQAWTLLSLDRLRAPYWVVALLLGAVVFTGQAIERSLAGPLTDLLDPQVLVFRLALPILTIYMLLAVKTLKTSALPILAAIRAAVRIGDSAFDNQVRAMLLITRRAEAALAAAAAAIIFAWFFVLRLPLPLMPGRYFLPANLWQAFVILAAYVIFAWSGLTLVYSSIRFARGLGKLSQLPLLINVFDPNNLLGFGRLSLRQSMTVAVTILLFVVPLGMPADVVEYGVLLLASMASLSALIFPLWGAHQQMAHARNAAASRIGSELAECQSRLMAATTLDAPTLADLADRIEKLSSIRSLIYKSPTWPFRNMPSVVRVVAAAMSPFLVFIVTEIIRTYLLPLIGVR